MKKVSLPLLVLASFLLGACSFSPNSNDQPEDPVVEDGVVDDEQDFIAEDPSHFGPFYFVRQAKEDDYSKLLVEVYEADGEKVHTIPITTSPFTASKVKLFNERILFINQDGGISSLDLFNEKINEEELDENIVLDEYNSVSDLLIAGNLLYYLVGCEGFSECQLYEKSLESGTNTIIADIPYEHDGGVEFHSYDEEGGTIMVKEVTRGGDEDINQVLLKSVILSDSRVVKEEAFSLTYCGEDGTGCTPEQLEENEEFNSFFPAPNPKTVSCGSAEIDTAKKGFFLGCWEF